MLTAAKKGNKAMSELLRSADAISDFKMETALKDIDDVVEIGFEDFGGAAGSR